MVPRWTLKHLLAGYADTGTAGDCLVTGLGIDSRKIETGHVFFALAGAAHDGHDYIDNAIDAGAAAIVCERVVGDRAVPVIVIESLAEQLGQIASRFYGAPSEALTVIGVTGTNGKTTVTQMIAQALDDKDGRCAVIGTIGNGFAEALDKSTHTTPDAISVHRLLATYRDAGARFVCMEVSSHALTQGRVSGVAFDLVVFTNLSRDHLDYHGDMAAYGAAKAMLFDVATIRIAIINGDDAYGRELIDRLKGRMAVQSFGLEAGDYHTDHIDPTRLGLFVELVTPIGHAEHQSLLFGRFNIYNLLAVVAVLLACGLDLEHALARLEKIQPAPGRMERFGGKADQPMVVVDYAHTPDALKQVLTALREHTEDKLWCVFGCGGDRDRGKRAEMGAIAERLADVVILTDDNPRSEAPEAIIADIISGMSTRPRVIHAREIATRTAIAEAQAGDIVVIAGKGHEDYQIVGAKTLHYSDRETVAALVGEAA